MNNLQTKLSITEFVSNWVMELSSLVELLIALAKAQEDLRPRVGSRRVMVPD
jgi:hypothetical protein